ncbi:hypothetical protein [Pseudonocardia spinosispora]|uniref:hypothetical protein n=1 Tax=Pseudonocardia spinosispora TaxID=103441 RepID=UPI0004162483|nr:hypothetical protein [Pseudonocardia spinosispora]
MTVSCHFLFRTRVLARLLLGLTTSIAVILAPGAASAATPVPFTPGPAIPRLGGFVPQGLAPWRTGTHDWLVISHYPNPGSAEHRNLISFVDRATGRVAKSVFTGGGHAGGVAVSPGFLWLANTEGARHTVVRFTLADIERAQDGTTVSGTPLPLPASSWATVAEGRLWVGDFAANTVYTYALAPDGRITPAGPPQPVPVHTQGMAVTASHLLYSVSYGRGNPSQIVVTDRRSGVSHPVAARGMTRGITTVDGTVYVNNESGAALYRDSLDGGGRAKEPVGYLQRAPLPALTSAS